LFASSNLNNFLISPTGGIKFVIADFDVRPRTDVFACGPS
jgi:hypothetical protein